MSTDYVSARYSFEQGNPVPDGMPFSIISEINHPPNVAVFYADSISDASDMALHAFMHGKQGAIWLNCNTLCFEDNFWEAQTRDNNIFVTLENYRSELEQKFPELLTINRREEHESQFDPHFDNFPLKLTDQFRSPKVTEFRIVINFDGTPTVVFGRNTVLSNIIHNGKKDINIDLFGHAYICPIGSALFILGGNSGLRNSLLHSFPQVPREGKKVVRDLAVIECTIK